MVHIREKRRISALPWHLHRYRCPFDLYQQKITTSMLDGRGVSGKVNNFGLGLSAEVGKKFGLTKDFFVEPQAQLAYYWIKGKDFSMSNGMKVEQGDFNSWVGRLGLVAGKDFKDAEGNTKAQVFVKGGVKQQFAGKQKLYANSVQFKDELKGTSGYYGLGFEANPNKKVSLYGQLERENGKHYTKEIEVMLGLRYKF
uniref:autotransporter outer membrane beta-barrel domain-containing protein n=1 Tax=Parasutterella excrementihominis TaxID=487175 RepID=UPI003FEFC45E